MFKFKLNKKRFESIESKVTGRKILEIAQLSPAEDFELLYKINDGGFTPIQLDEVIDLKEVGKEVFIARPYEEFSIKVDSKEYTVNECFLSPNEIMEIAGIDSSRFFLNEVRENGNEITYKEDAEHKISLSKSLCFISCERDPIECVIVNAKQQEWTKRTISFEDVIIMHYGQISNNPNVIYTVTYKRGVPTKPEGSLVKGETISVNNKMIFNVTQTNKS